MKLTTVTAELAEIEIRDRWIEFVRFVPGDGVSTHISFAITQDSRQEDGFLPVSAPEIRIESYASRFFVAATVFPVFPLIPVAVTVGWRPATRAEKGGL